MVIHKDVSLAPVLWYKIGGKARYLLDCSNREDVFAALDFIGKNHIKKVFVIGLGSNLLFTDSYFDGAVIRIVCATSALSSTQGLSLKKTSDGYVESFSGETLDNLIAFSFDHNFIGLEWAGGLPGTVGAGVRGNVGAFGGEIKDVFYRAEALKMGNGGFETVSLSHADLNFSYRNTSLKQNKSILIISSTFILSETDYEQVARAKQLYHAHVQYREDKHPLEYPNCGSVFKNIVKKEEVEKVLSVLPDIEPKVQQEWHGKVAMGHLIHHLGFSGYQIGGAKVSHKHANFIVNVGGATFDNVVVIIQEIRKRFSEKFGFYPETEVEIVSQDVLAGGRI